MVPGYLYRICVFILFTCTLSRSYAQVDTSFWFAAPAVYFTDKPILLRIFTYSSPATVAISQPAGGGLPTQTVSIPAASTATVDLSTWISLLENTPGNTVLNYGLKISSTAAVSIYYEISSVPFPANPEIYVLKGQSALGNTFLIPSQNVYGNNGPMPTFDIVATENNTRVTINPSNDIFGHNAGIPFHIDLNEGQTYSAIGADYRGPKHLQGSVVTSNKPIAITVNDDWLDLWGGSDLAGDQILPINRLGKEYIAIAGNLRDKDRVYIVGTENGTQLSQNGTAVATIGYGQTYELKINTSSTYIQADKPVYALHLSGTWAEAGEALIPELGCSGSSEAVFIRTSTMPQYINLLVKAGGEGSFLINGVGGVITASQFTTVPGTSGQWYAASILLSMTSYPAGTTIRISNPVSYFQMSMINGEKSNGASFGYLGNYTRMEPNITTDTLICAGSPIILEADSFAGATYDWSGPDHFSSNNRKPVINPALPVKSGTYTVTVTSANCTATESVNVNVAPLYDTFVNSTICAGSYLLFGGDTLRQEGRYNHNFLSSAGCDSAVTLSLNVKPKAIAYFDMQPKACITDTINLYPDTQPQISYKWEPGDADIIPATGNVPLQLRWKHTGKKVIRLTASNLCGDSTLADTITIYDNPVTAITDIMKGDICGDDTVKLKANGLPTYTYAWQPKEYIYYANGPEATALLPISSKVTVTVTDTTGCIATAEAEVYNDAGCCNLAIASAFTPNGDGKNDLLRVITLAYNQKLNFFRIYNRWGQTVFEARGITDGWDGVFKGTPQDAGNYTYMLEYRCTDGSIHLQKGEFTLIR